MINTRELRIGNWILDAKGNQIQAPGFADYNNPLIHPIPLTEEILEKCGFEWDDIVTHADEREPIRGLFKDGIMMLPHGDTKYWYAAPFGYPIMTARTMHLHQLQNLYFALTGEELTYQP